MASRKSNVVLTIEQRRTIIGQLESGVAVSTIAAIYNVHQKTIRRIGQDAARINRLVDSDEKHKKVKRFKKPMYEDLENLLYTWFVGRRDVGVIVTDALLLEKATEFAKNLQIPTFRASRGWATKFKKRHNIRLLKLHGEKESADENVDTEEKYLQECKVEEFIVADDEESETDRIQNRDESNDSDEEINSDQKEARLSGRTREELDELKYLHERLRHLCVTDPPYIRETYEVLRRYHFGEYDTETTQRRELGHSSHQ